MDWAAAYFPNPGVRSARLLFNEITPAEYAEFARALSRVQISAIPLRVTDDTTGMKVQARRPLSYRSFAQKVQGAWWSAFRGQGVDLPTPTIIDTSVSPWKNR